MATPSPDLIERSRRYVHDLTLDSLQHMITDLREDYIVSAGIDSSRDNIDRYGAIWTSGMWPCVEYAKAWNDAIGTKALRPMLERRRTRIKESFWLDLRELVFAHEGIHPQFPASAYLGLKDRYSCLWSAIDSYGWNALNVSFDSPRQGKRYPYLGSQRQIFDWNTRPDTFTIPLAEHWKRSKRGEERVETTLIR